MNYYIVSSNPRYNGIEAFLAAERYLKEHPVNRLDELEMERVKEFVASAAGVQPEEIDISFY